ncbi:hypothetical protein, partial [Streptomyces sp. NPDC052127]|uniref:hypothetical protein n=1 Tax=Streptomyces sp. NPDC052127 TaxID=3155679 RepID=UPI003436BFDB
VAGRVVWPIPHRGGTGDEAALPADYRKILPIVRAADGPVQVRAVGEELGLEVPVRGKPDSKDRWTPFRLTAAELPGRVLARLVEP